MLSIDLKNDWQSYIEKELIQLDFPILKNLSIHSLTVNYFNIKRRLISKSLKKIYEAKELQINENDKAGYSLLKELFLNGGDLTPFLSRDILKKEYKPDILLNLWGINHLHFLESGSENILFIKIIKNDVYFLQSFSHGENGHYPFENIELLNIINNNWPELLRPYKTNITGENLTSKQRHNLQAKNHLNTIILLSNGESILPPSGIISILGTSFDDIRNADKFLSVLDMWTAELINQENSLCKSLNINTDKPIYLHAKFKDNFYINKFDEFIDVIDYIYDESGQKLKLHIN